MHVPRLDTSTTRKLAVQADVAPKTILRALALIMNGDRLVHPSLKRARKALEDAGIVPKEAAVTEGVKP